MKDSLKKEFNFALLILVCGAGLVLVWKILHILAIILLVAPTFVSVHLKRVSFNNRQYNSEKIRSFCLSVSFLCALFIFFSKGKVTSSVCHYFIGGRVYTTSWSSEDDDGRESTERWSTFRAKNPNYEPIVDAIGWILLVSIFLFPGINWYLYNKVANEIEDV